MTRPILRLHDGFDHTSPELRDEVRELQTLLNSYGLSVDVDGLFGGDTEDAVKQFQRLNRLEDDGIVGALTWAALLGTPPPPTPDGQFPTTRPRNDADLLHQLDIVNDLRPVIEAAALRIGLPPAVLCGLGSRESRWGLALRPQGPAGTGDAAPRRPRPPLRPGHLPPDGGGFGRGLMQIDFDAHEFARTGNWRDAEANIDFGATVLAAARNFIRRRAAIESIPLDELELLRAALAGYNCGPGNALRALRDGRDIDFFTAHRDYSKDVLDRAGWFQLHGWE